MVTPVPRSQPKFSLRVRVPADSVTLLRNAVDDLLNSLAKVCGSRAFTSYQGATLYRAFGSPGLIWVLAVGSEGRFMYLVGIQQDLNGYVGQQRQTFLATNEKALVAFAERVPHLVAGLLAELVDVDVPTSSIVEGIRRVQEALRLVQSV